MFRWWFLDNGIGKILIRYRYMDVVLFLIYRCVSLGFVEWEISCTEECVYFVIVIIMLSVVILILEGVLWVFIVVLYFIFLMYLDELFYVINSNVI